MANHELGGRWALVTGASSGLGVDFAHELAQRRMNLVLVARREARLREVKAELEAQHDVNAAVISRDLAPLEAPRELYDEVKERGIQIDVLVNNAGFGVYGEFAEVPWEREEAMLKLDILTVVHLTKLFVKDMLARDFGYILQVSSIGAYLPSPTYATYSAAKSFVLNFGEALDYELRDGNVSCTVVSPGVAATEFLKVSGQEPTLYQRLIMMESDEVAKTGIEKMLAEQPSVVPGWLNAIMVWSNRLTPRRLSAAVGHKLMTVA